MFVLLWACQAFCCAESEGAGVRRQSWSISTVRLPPSASLTVSSISILICPKIIKFLSMTCRSPSMAGWRLNWSMPITILFVNEIGITRLHMEDAGKLVHAVAIASRFLLLTGRLQSHWCPWWKLSLNPICALVKRQLNMPRNCAEFCGISV